MKNIMVVRSDVKSGGPKSLILSVVTGLRGRGYRVVLVCGSCDREDDVRACTDALYIFEEMGFSHRGLVANMRLLPKLRNVIRTEQIDAICGFNSGSTLMAYLSKVGMFRKIGLLNNIVGPGRFWFQRLLPFRSACMSDAQKKQLVKHGVRKSKLLTIYPSTLDLKRFDYDAQRENIFRDSFPDEPDPILVGMVMNGEKGRRDLVPTMERLCGVFSRLRWICVGNTRVYDTYQELLRSSPYRNRVLFTGLRDDIPSVMFSFDILSHYITDYGNDNMETFGMVVTEAMVMGTPVISNNQGGPSEIIVDSVTGFLVDNIEEFQKAVTRLVEDEELRKTMGQRSRERALTMFTQDKFIDSIEAALLES